MTVKARLYGLILIGQFVLVKDETNIYIFLFLYLSFNYSNYSIVGVSHARLRQVRAGECAHPLRVLTLLCRVQWVNLRPRHLTKSGRDLEAHVIPRIDAKVNIVLLDIKAFFYTSLHFHYFVNLLRYVQWICFILYYKTVRFTTPF